MQRGPMLGVKRTSDGSPEVPASDDWHRMVIGSGQRSAGGLRPRRMYAIASRMIPFVLTSE